jgi:hypothetical protein
MCSIAHASGKADGQHAEVVGRIESLSTNLSNVVVRLLGGMMVTAETKSKEMEVDDLPGFLDKQTNVIVQAIQTLLLVIKNPATATSVCAFLLLLKFSFFFFSLTGCCCDCLGLSDCHRLSCRLCDAAEECVVSRDDKEGRCD